jgi:hypothetical protein
VRIGDGRKEDEQSDPDPDDEIMLHLTTAPWLCVFHDRDHGLIAARAIKRAFTGRIWLDASEHHPDGI